MLTILEGQISFGGMHDALEAVARHKNIKHGLLRITSNSGSGLIGVFCGRFITGAVITLSGDMGYAALRKLLAAKDGTFALMDATDDPVPEVNQSLGVDLQTLLSSIDFTLESIPISEESLTGMQGGFDDEITLIDTEIQHEFSVEELSPPERIERINQTYQKVLSLSEHNRQNPSSVATGNITSDFVQDEEYFANQRFERESATGAQTESLRGSEPLASPSLTANPTDYSNLSAAEIRSPHAESNDVPAKTPDDFKRLKNWNDKGQKMMNLAWLLVAIIIIAAISYYAKDLATIVSGVIPRS